MKANRIPAACAGCLLVLMSHCLTAFAEVALPDGAVKGLPERLAALDNEGNAVNSATGEYFFRVEDMAYGVTYTKDVQLMNLREDASYNIYFYVEPLWQDGEIDLGKGCECTFSLDGTEFYRGDVNGKGNFDLSATYYHCGCYAPGDSHVLHAEVTWNDLDVLQHVDNGHRLVDQDGTHVLVGPDESGHVEGEIEFKWIFFASIEESPQTTTTRINDDEIVDTQTTRAKDDSADTTTEPHHSDVEANTDGSGTQTASPTTHTTTVATIAPPSGNNGASSPFTGYLAKDGKVWLIAMGVIGAMIVLLLLLIHRQKRKDRRP